VLRIRFKKFSWTYSPPLLYWTLAGYFLLCLKRGLQLFCVKWVPCVTVYIAESLFASKSWIRKGLDGFFKCCSSLTVILSVLPTYHSWSRFPSYRILPRWLRHWAFATLLQQAFRRMALCKQFQEAGMVLRWI